MGRGKTVPGRGKAVQGRSKAGVPERRRVEEEWRRGWRWSMDSSSSSSDSDSDYLHPIPRIQTIKSATKIPLKSGKSSLSIKSTTHDATKNKSDLKHNSLPVYPSERRVTNKDFTNTADPDNDIRIHHEAAINDSRSGVDGCSDPSFNPPHTILEDHSGSHAGPRCCEYSPSKDLKDAAAPEDGRISGGMSRPIDSHQPGSSQPLNSAHPTHWRETRANQGNQRSSSQNHQQGSQTPQQGSTQPHQQGGQIVQQGLNDVRQGVNQLPNGVQKLPTGVQYVHQAPQGVHHIPQLVNQGVEDLQHNTQFPSKDLFPCCQQPLMVVTHGDCCWNSTGQCCCQPTGLLGMHQ